MKIFSYFGVMKNKKKKVLLAYNEPSPELYHKFSQESKDQIEFIPYFEVEQLSPMEEYEVMAKKLSEVEFEPTTLNILDNIHILINEIKNNPPDVIFNFIEIYNENPRLEMNIVGLFELMRIPYTGASPTALVNCQSKVLTKRILGACGIKSPRFILIKKQKSRYVHHLRYPLMIKPAFEDASVGIENDSIVFNHKELLARVDYVLSYFSQPALVEEFIEGRELNVAVIGDINPFALPLSEIDFSSMPDHLHNIVSYQAKWDPLHEAYHKTIPICPAQLPGWIENKAKNIALVAFKEMGCRDYARIDMRLDKENELYVLEVNPNPDLTEDMGFMRSAEAAGISYIEALTNIINFAYARGKRFRKQ
jgi:D-alanine-D-alanine ligase